MTILRTLLTAWAALTASLNFASAATAAAAGCKLGVMAALPVTMVGTTPTLAAQINGVDATFEVDSGAWYSVITPGSAAQFGLSLRPAPFGLVMNGVGGTNSAQVTTVKKFGVIGTILPNREFIVGGSEIGYGHNGVIGQNILGIGDTEYDLAKGVVRLIKPEGCGRNNFPYWSKSNDSSEIEIETGQRNQIALHTMATAYLNGTAIRVLFDTGASVSMISRSAAKRAGVDVDSPGAVRSGFAAGFGKRTEPTWIVPVDSFKIGDEEIRKTRLRVIDSPFSRGSDAPDMLIGADFFLSHHVYVAKSLHKLYFTYNGGAVFNLKAVSNDVPRTAAAAIDLSPEVPGLGIGATPGTAPATSSDEPTTAEALARRGNAFAARRDYGHAVADLSKAIGLAPDEPRYLLDRARLYFASDRPLLASADLDHSLRLQPANLQALTMRAGYRLARHDKDGARADLDAADKVAPPESDLRFEMAQLYERVDALPQAVAQLDLWIKAHRDDVKQARALNSRCWTRALLGEQLELALKDCNAALRLSQKNPGFLDSRGLVYLRQGDDAKAIADYDAALAQRPKLAWSHYGRGIARLRQGSANEAKADIAEALTLDADIERFAKEHGIAP